MASPKAAERVEEVPVAVHSTALDGGYGWVVLFASFISFLIADGWSYSFGVLFPEIVKYFEESRGATSMVGTLLYAVPMIVSPFACALVSTYGYRVIGVVGGLATGLPIAVAMSATSVGSLCVIVGVIAGFGLALVYVSAFFAVTVYFDRRRGLATGIAVAGSGIGALAFPPLIERLIEIYAWHGTMLIAGGICFNLMVVGALFRPLPVDTPESECDSKAVIPNRRKHRTDCMNLLVHEVRGVFTLMFDRVTFSSVPFFVFCIANFGLYLGISTPYVYIVDYAMLRAGSLQWDATLLLSISGIGRIVGQFVFGVLGDVPRVSPTVLFACGSILTGLLTALVPVLALNYPMLGVYAALFGFCASVTYVLPMICLVEILGLDRAVNAFGFVQLVQGVATLAGTPIPGQLFDAHQSYDIGFYIAGVLMLCSGLMALLAQRILKCKR